MHAIMSFTLNHLADAFIQTNLQMRTTEAIKPTKEQQNIYVCCDKSRLVLRSTRSKVFF